MRALILSRLVVDYSRAMLRNISPFRRNAEGLADSLLLSAIYVGQFDGRPMTAYKLSEYTGIPRPTVARKLKELQAAGLIVVEGRRAVVPDRIITSDAFNANQQELTQLVMRAAKELSKLDSKPIARRPKK